MVKVAIIGSRSFDNYGLVHNLVKLWGQGITRGYAPITQVINGDARGSDRIGSDVAAEFGIPVRSIPANWDEYGKSAGILRNADIVDACDLVVAFWDYRSPGTRNALDVADRYGKPSIVLRFGEICQGLAKFRPVLQKTENATYIGRGSEWGNPYSAKDEPGLAVETVGSTPDALALFELYARTWDDSKLDNLRTAMTKPFRCFCHDASRCHGEVLSRLAWEYFPGPEIVDGGQIVVMDELD